METKKSKPFISKTLVIQGWKTIIINCDMKELDQTASDKVRTTIAMTPPTLIPEWNPNQSHYG
tara:strand:- start:49 stop:237 length:189 start_codon:yes stop_codon:yes gene_type:complete